MIVMEDVFKKYGEYPQAAIVLDSDFNIIYKNPAAKKDVNIKPRMGVTIKKYMDSGNMEKLCSAVEHDEFRILKLDVFSALKRCVAQPDSNKSVTALVFYSSLNLLKEGGENEGEIISKAEDLILKYNRQRKATGKITGGHVSENSKKIARINEHFRRHITNLSPNNTKTTCNIADFLNKFTAGISQYVNSFGYKVGGGKSADRMFHHPLNENDLLLINYILSAAAFKYSVFNKIDIRFSDDFNKGIIRYEFRTSKDFIKTHEDMFAGDYLKEMKDIEYLDLNLAALLAKNNDIGLKVYFDADESSVFFDLIFKRRNQKNPGKPEVESPLILNYISAEKVREGAEIEFAGIFSKDNI